MSALPFSSPVDYEHRVSCESPGEAHWFVFRGNDLLVELGPPTRPSDDPRVRARPAWARLPYGSALQKNHNWLGPAVLRTLYLGRLAGSDCWAAELPGEAEPPAGMAFAGLRTLFSVLDDAHFALAGRALQLVDWDRTHQFCGRCGARTEPRREERVRVCPACKLSAYPRVAPAVMALVHREKGGRHELLLGRSPHFPPGMYSALAGFVEPGESLEQCVAREVAEEVGVRVERLRYFASQPWPFPHSLMIAFICEWRDGELALQDAEIEDAKWFDVLQLPKLPSRISIARRLIDSLCQELIGRSGGQT
ncbi:MAG TPA: NAD(+) diphosphatase [Burkholderiales bacterium]